MNRVCKHSGCTGIAYKVGYCNGHYIRSRRGSEMDRPIGKRSPDPERFWQKVKKTGACWEWVAYRDRAGYGRFMVGGVPKLAHRVSYALAFGSVPEGSEIDHVCHNPACVNPDHLRPASRSHNAQNMSGARADSASGIRGVRLRESGRWSATASTNGKTVALGTFASPEDAEAAVAEWRRQNMPYSEMDKKKEVEHGHLQHNGT
jgi:hypothetical protein